MESLYEVARVSMIEIRITTVGEGRWVRAEGLITLRCKQGRETDDKGTITPDIRECVHEGTFEDELTRGSGLISFVSSFEGRRNLAGSRY